MRVRPKDHVHIAPKFQALSRSSGPDGQTVGQREPEVVSTGRATGKAWPGSGMRQGGP